MTLKNPAYSDIRDDQGYFVRNLSQIPQNNHWAVISYDAGKMLYMVFASEKSWREHARKQSVETLAEMRFVQVSTKTPKLRVEVDM